VPISLGFTRYSNTYNQSTITLFNTSATIKMQKKSLNSPDEVRIFEKGKIEIANLGDMIIGRSTFEL
jgi:hypothetical protein